MLIYYVKTTTNYKKLFLNFLSRMYPLTLQISQTIIAVSYFEHPYHVSKYISSLTELGYLYRIQIA